MSAKEAEAYELGDADEKKAEASSFVPAAQTQTGGVDAELLKKKEALTAEWAVWKDQALINTYVNFTLVQFVTAMESWSRSTRAGQLAYTPLMIHWAVGGLWTNPLITSIIGLVPVYGKLHRAWRNAA